jgi:hypothetical protein
MFLQGDVSDHSHAICSLEEAISITREKGIAFLNYPHIFDNWDRIGHAKWWTDKNPGMRSAEMNLAEFWTYLFGTDHPTWILVYYGACFGTSRERILRRPKEFYVRALKTVSDHQNPEEGHYFERFWGEIFG